MAEAPKQDPEPLNVPFDKMPQVLNGRLDLQHAWRSVNWVYATRVRLGVSKRSRRSIVRQTAGILILALGILCDEAYAKYNWGQENSSDSEQISDAERAQWGQLAMDAELRRVYIVEKQPHIVTSMKSYKSPRAISMVHDTCYAAMDRLREQEVTLGCKFVDGTEDVLREFIAWWKLLIIGIAHDPQGMTIVTKETCEKNIARLETWIALAEKSQE